MSSYTYPGVYIDELPSAVHTISGVATSIAAFAGWATQGPTDQATMVESFSDFQRQFGGLNANSYLGYAVNQFFANGGSQAYIVRLVNTSTSGSLVAAATASSKTPAFTIAGLTVYAKNDGNWGNAIAITVTISSGRFNVQVLQVPTSGSPTTLENFVNLSTDPNDSQGNYFVAVINNESNYITFIDAANPNATLTPDSSKLVALTQQQLKDGNDGTMLVPGDGNFETALNADNSGSNGVQLLKSVFFNLLVVPGETDSSTIGKLQAFVADSSNRAFLIVDSAQTDTYAILDGTTKPDSSIITAPNAGNSALYFPWVSAPDPLAGNRSRLFPPSGFVAGIYAATDAARGVWKAPAGIGAGISGITGLQYVLTDQQNGDLNTKAINCLRTFPVYGNVVWGARTLLGNDAAGSQWKYVPIRRFALFLESSLYQGTQWAVFEPNDEALWSQLRMNIGAFMQGLFQQGAFQGSTPQTAYFVKCDAENNPQQSIDQGIVNVTVGFAPLYPAEFVVIQIAQMAGQTAA